MSTYNSCEDYVLDRVAKLERENEELHLALLAERNENLTLCAQLSLIADHAKLNRCSNGESYIDITVWDSNKDYRDLIDALNLSADEEAEDE